MREITHRLKKRSFWDGAVTALCGQTYQPGYYRESWLSLGPISCRGCRAALGKK